MEENALQKKQSKKRKENIKKTVIDTIILILVAFIVAYAAYKVVQLFIKPSNVAIVQQGTVTSEESTLRICNKK